MTDTALIDALRARVATLEGRFSMPPLGTIRPLPPPATREQIARTERAIGIPLHPFHVRVLTEVANGGFGPGFGVLGAEGGWTDPDLKETLIESKRTLFDPLEATQVVPLCPFGVPTWACVESSSGRILTRAVDPQSPSLEDLRPILHIAPFTIQSWFEAWLQRVDLYRAVIEYGKFKAINPFTREWQEVSRPTGVVIGEVYVDR